MSTWWQTRGDAALGPSETWKDKESKLVNISTWWQTHGDAGVGPPETRKDKESTLVNMSTWWQTLVVMLV